MVAGLEVMAGVVMALVAADPWWWRWCQWEHGGGGGGGEGGGDDYSDGEWLWSSENNDSIDMITVRINSGDSDGNKIIIINKDGKKSGDNNGNNGME